MNAVLDCSAAIEIARGTERGGCLRDAIALDMGGKLMAPELYYAEVGSACSKYYRAGITDMATTKAIARDALDLVDETRPLAPLYAEAMAESLRLGHSIYDMFYLVLARREDATLITCDRRLNSLCESEGVDHIVHFELDASAGSVKFM